MFNNMPNMIPNGVPYTPQQNTLITNELKRLMEKIERELEYIEKRLNNIENTLTEKANIYNSNVTDNTNGMYML